jgi:preprotein translocase subunit SecE
MQKNHKYFLYFSIIAFIASLAIFMVFNIDLKVKYYLASTSLICSILLFCFSRCFNFIKIYFLSSYSEAQKVVWPSKNDVIRITIMVFVFVFIMAIFLWAADGLMSWVVYDVLLNWR